MRGYDAEANSMLRPNACPGSGDKSATHQHHNPCTLHAFSAGLDLIDWLDGPAHREQPFDPRADEHLMRTCVPVGWPRCKSSRELRLERQYRDRRASRWPEQVREIGHE